MLRKFIKSISNFLPVEVPLFRRIKKFVENFDKSQNDRMIGYFDWMDIITIKKLFKKEIRKDVENYNVHDFFHSLLRKIPSEHTILNKMLFLERNTFLVDHNLNYTDKMAMAVGVEVRVPYLDRDLVAFAQQLNPNLKLKGLETKYLLKKVAERYLPKEIIYRPKTGFGAPVRKWITVEMNDMIRERLSEQNIKRQGIFDYEKVQELINKNKSGGIDASYTIWSLLAISSWIDQFFLHKKSFSI
jgi:asparagine synthase (glutamine-hydrolysing)